MLRQLIFTLCLYGLLAGPVAAEDLAAALARTAPDADPDVLQLAQQAMACASATGMAAPERLAVIDYSLPSTLPRLWVFDLGQRRLLFRELVAHGRNSGENIATTFSNEPGSNASSLGVFLGQETYEGVHGYSLRMDGLEPGFNDRARERFIVMHGAAYVDEGVSEKLGHLGRSLGCPAVRAGMARQIIDHLKGGQFVLSYYPDAQWLQQSQFLNCQSALERAGGQAATVLPAVAARPDTP